MVPPSLIFKSAQGSQPKLTFSKVQTQRLPISASTQSTQTVCVPGSVCVCVICVCEIFVYVYTQTIYRERQLYTRYLYRFVHTVIGIRPFTALQLYLARI